jgi:hypothetical protein
LGERYGVDFAEAFHYIGPGDSRRSAVEDYVQDNAVRVK